MEDSTADGLYSPDPLCLPVEERQIQAAREMLRENKGAQWSVCCSTGIQVGGNVELRDNLVALLVEFDVPMATISDMFGLSGREVWTIGYRCQVCGERDTRLDVHHNTYDRYGDEGPFDLVALCGGCHEVFHGIVEDAS